MLCDGFGATIPNSPSLDALPDGFTLAAWIKPTSIPGWVTLFFKTDRHNQIHMLHVQTDGRLHAALNNTWQGFSNSIVPLDEWSHVACTLSKPF